MTRDKRRSGAVRGPMKNPAYCTPVIRLAPEDQVRVAQLLLDPPPLAPAMERARVAHARMQRELNESADYLRAIDGIDTATHATIIRRD